MTAPRRDGVEEPWRAWVRNNARLDSIGAGLGITDSDLWVHRYKVEVDRQGTREIQHVMLTEWKTFGANVSASQADTLQVIDAVLRHAGKRFLRLPRKGGCRNVRSWGVHTVQLSGSDPTSSTIIRWDGHQIDAKTLEELLRFERDPDTLNERSDRRHHAPSVQDNLQLRLRAVRKATDV
jgi:hypothetical protein